MDTENQTAPEAQTQEPKKEFQIMIDTRKNVIKLNGKTLNGILSLDLHMDSESQNVIINYDLNCLKDNC